MAAAGQSEANVYARVLLVSSVIRCKLNRRCDPRSPRCQHRRQGIAVCPRSGQCAEIDRHVFEHVLYHASRDAHFADAGLHPLGVLTSHMRPSSPFSDLYNKSEPMVASRSGSWYHDILLRLLEPQEASNGACNMIFRDGTEWPAHQHHLAVATAGTFRSNPSPGQRHGAQVLQHSLPIAIPSTAHSLWSTHKLPQGSRAPRLPGSQTGK